MAESPRKALFHGTSPAPIFIGGLMKSGTSLLRVLLGQHPAIHGTFETHWFDEDLRLNWQDGTTRRMGLLTRFLDAGAERIAGWQDAKRADPDREFIDIVLAEEAARAGKPRWVEKTPDNIRWCRVILAQWPHARFIHVTREYKDCFASWKDKRGDSLDTFLASAARAYDAVEDLLGRSAPNYLEVDYADLVGDTEAAMRRVLAFAGAPWDGACAAIDTELTGEERVKVQEVTGKDSKTSISLAKPIFTDSLGQWRSILTAEEARRIETELAHRYAALGARWAG